MSIPFERNDFTFTVPFQFCCPGLQFVQAPFGAAVKNGRRSPAQPAPGVLEGGSTWRHHVVQPEGQSFLAALSCRPARLSLIPSPVSLFCPGSARGRHLMGFDKDRPANLTKAR